MPGFCRKVAKTLPEARQEAQRPQEEADKALAESESLKLQARLDQTGQKKLGRTT
jgi:hypothetical protein